MSSQIRTEVGIPATRVEIRNLSAAPVIIREIRLNGGSRPEWRSVWCRLPDEFAFRSNGLEGIPISQAACDWLYSYAAQDGRNIGELRYATPDDSFATPPGATLDVDMEQVAADQILEVEVITAGGATRLRFD